MKKYIYLILSSLILISCNENKIDQLNSQIAELENKNSILLDSINKLNKVNSYTLIGLPHLKNYKVGQPGKITFYIHEFKNFNDIKVFEISDDGKKSDLIKEGIKESNFEIEFTPKTINDKKVMIQAEFERNGELWKVPAYLIIDVEK